MRGILSISNNYTELMAAVMALTTMPDGWDGELLTDSNITRCRLVNASPAMNGIPVDFQERLHALKRRLGKFTVTLLQGHPTEAELAKGVGKSGRPVSPWNVLCDEMCTAEAVRFMERAKQ